MIRCLAAFLGCGFLLSSAQAASVSWSAEQIAATGTSQISQQGTFLEGINLGFTGSDDVTIDGVLFAEGDNTTDLVNSFTYFDSAVGTNFIASATFTGGTDWFTLGTNTAYAGIMDTARGRSTPTNSVFTISSLTIGQEYLLQIFAADLRNISGVNNRSVYMDGSPLAGAALGVDGSGNGTVISGIFTADAATQDITMGIFDPDNGTLVTAWQINGMQLRAIPEPGAFALMAGFLALASIAVRRRVA
jgi:hypothetical protein